MLPESEIRLFRVSATRWKKYEFCRRWLCFQLDRHTPVNILFRLSPGVQCLRLRFLQGHANTGFVDDAAAEAAGQHFGELPAIRRSVLPGFHGGP